MKIDRVFLKNILQSSHFWLELQKISFHRIIQSKIIAYIFEEKESLLKKSISI